MQQTIQAKKVIEEDESGGKKEHNCQYHPVIVLYPGRKARTES